MKAKLLRHYRLASFLGGWLAVAALPPFYLLPVLLISFPLLLWLINRSPTAGQAFRTGYYFGFAFFAFGFSWINHALLLDAASFGWLVPIVFLACGFFFGLFIAFPAWLSWYFAQKPRGALNQYLAFAALWVIFEWLRSFFLSGFPWNLLGTSLVFSDNLIQAASLGGTYLLSLLVLLATGAPFLWLADRRPGRLVAAAGIPLVIFLSLWLFGAWRIQAHPCQPSETVLRLVQPAIPQTLKWNPAVLEDNLNRHIKMSQQPGFEAVDFVIWSETAFPYLLEQDVYHRGLLQYAIPPKGRLITGAVRYQPLGDKDYHAYNSMFIIEPDGKIVAHYDKSHLVPFGEYIPLRRFLPQWVRPVVSAAGNFQPGSGPAVIRLPDQPSLGGLICYEVIFPHRIVNPADRPQWLVNLTNDGWYGDSAGPWQHLAATRLRAAEEGITIARAAGSGVSALISPLGIVIDQISLHKEGVLDVKLPIETQFSTTYGRFGNPLPLFLCALLLILAIRRSRSNN